jgi:hypothetical protein
MHFSTKQLIASTLLASATLSSAARVTYYNPEDPAQTHGSGAGIGSCGSMLSSNVHSAAIAGLPWGSAQCGATVAVTNNANGQCMEMPVLDNCAGCAPDAIDLTESAFRALFGSGGVGDGSWTYGSCTQATVPEVSPATEDSPIAPEIEQVVPEVAQEQPEQAAPAIPQAAIVKAPAQSTTQATQATQTTQAAEASQTTQAAKTSSVSKPTSNPANVVANPISQPVESTQAGLSTGAIVGIVVGSVAAVAVVAGSIVYAQRRKQVSVHTIADQSPVTTVEATA